MAGESASGVRRLRWGECDLRRHDQAISRFDRDAFGLQRRRSTAASAQAPAPRAPRSQFQTVAIDLSLTPLDQGAMNLVGVVMKEAARIAVCWVGLICLESFGCGRDTTIEPVDLYQQTSAETQSLLPSCSGTGCNGLDPYKTSCRKDAKTVAKIYGQGVKLELRWSPSCQSNWARATAEKSVAHIVYVQAPAWPWSGRSETQDTGEGLVRWSNMWYAPGSKIQACWEPCFECYHEVLCTEAK